MATIASTAWPPASAHAGLGQCGTVQAGLAVHVLGGDQLAHQRPRAAGMDGQIGPSGEFAHLARILLGQRQRHVAGDHGDREHVQLVRRAERQQDGERIVMTGVAVDDDGAGGHLSHGRSQLTSEDTA